MNEKAKCKNCTNKKEMIEEMANEICKVCCERHKKYFRQDKEPRLCEFYGEDCPAFDHAEILHNAGYRKPLEGAVVLSEEEYERLHKDINDYKQRYQSSEKRYEQLVQSSYEAITKSRKGTAKEILKTIYDGLNKYYTTDHIKELAKEYGVEVEE